MKLNEVKGDHGWKVEIVKDDQSISRLWIVDRQMRIGRCPVFEKFSISNPTGAY